MSTTNPEHGRPPADTVGGLAAIAAGSPRADDHGASGPPAAETSRAATRSMPTTRPVSSASSSSWCCSSFSRSGRSR